MAGMGGRDIEWTPEELEVLRLLMSKQVQDPYRNVAPEPEPGQMQEPAGAFEHLSPRSMGGFLTDQDMLDAQGSIENRKVATDPLLPAYQGAAQGMASVVAPPLQSGSAFMREPSVPNATKFGLDTAMSAAPWRGAMQSAMDVAKIGIGGAGVSLGQDMMGIGEAEAQQARRKNRQNGNKRPALKPTIMEPAETPTAQAGEPEFKIPDMIIKAAERDPRVAVTLEKLKTVRRAQAEEIARLTRSYTDAANKGYAGPIAKGIQDDIDKAKTRHAEELAPIDAELNERIKPYLPFDQTFPNLSQNMSGLQLGIPALAGVATRGLGRAALNVEPSRLNQAVRQGERAMDGTWFRKPNAPLADRKLAEVQDALKKFDNPGRFTGIRKRAEHFNANTGMPMVAGAVAGAELSALPEQYNRRNALPGTREHTEAERKLSPKNIRETLQPGATMGALGALTASHITPGLKGNIKPNISRAKAFVSRLDAKKASTSPAADAMKRDAKAAQDVQNANTPPPPGTPQPKPEPPKKKPRDKWWDSALARMRKSKDMDEALHALDTDPAFAKLNIPKRRKLIEGVFRSNPNATPQEIARKLRAHVTKARKSGGFYSLAIGSTLGGSEILDEDE